MAPLLLQAAKAIADTLGSADAPPPVPDVMSSPEATLSKEILVFALAVLLLEAGIIKIAEIKGRDAIRLVTVTLILTCTIYLITAGYSNQQTAGATGLLGTIAGYLLGNSAASSPPSNPGT